MPFWSISCQGHFSFMWSALSISQFLFNKNEMHSCLSFREMLFATKPILSYIEHLTERQGRTNLNKTCSQSGVSSLLNEVNCSQSEVIELCVLLGTTVHALKKSLPSKNSFSLIVVISVYLCASLVSSEKECNTIVVRLQALINLECRRC